MTASSSTSPIDAWTCCRAIWWLLPGQPPGDWTKGCIAVTDAEIEEIWALVADGTPVEIRP